ncbi:MAG: T9SS type A sorting domain-containing protein [Candidatus Eisenbacteria bacterium]|uniref:T9SS type A sorting domain-containing protein n=1 Tax=Eiseniibacteriota bacterium TaxID=2212470 RepID=A0A956M2H4_UNCEI|nr:T9SS type A sorting domain-containing protein [Candidatus Eisenbacteria bacterium]
MAVAATTILASERVSAQDVESWTLTIDNATTQPVATGLVAVAQGDQVIILAEGAIRRVVDSGRYDAGWHGPAGQTRLRRVGQPVAADMPYGALIGGFTSDDTQFEHVGRIGSFGVEAAEVGQEFYVSLNMSDADLLGLEGAVTVTLVYVPTGSANTGEFILDDASPDKLPTGFFPATGDKFIVLPFGGVRPTFGSGNPNTGGWFGPGGRPQVTRAGQPLPDGPYGSLYGQVDTLSTPFYIGDGGCWSTQPIDIGQELTLLLNMPASDRATLSGGIVVNVIQVPVPSPAAEEDPRIDGFGSAGLQISPNPMVGGGVIRFSLPQPGPVRVRLADASGRWVRNVLDEESTAGPQELSWDGRDENGELLPAGVYFVQLSTVAGSKSGRIVITK